MSEAATLTRDQIEALLNVKMPDGWHLSQDGVAALQTALLAWTEDDRLWKDVARDYENLAMRQLDEIARQIARAEAVEDALATERARREACEAALEPFANRCTEIESLGQSWIEKHTGPTMYRWMRAARAALNPAASKD